MSSIFISHSSAYNPLAQELGRRLAHQNHHFLALDLVFLNFFLDDRYFPFEGTGAVSTWRLEMPHETNPDIDFTQVEDVIIHLRYTAKSDSGKFKEDVKDLIEAM